MTEMDEHQGQGGVGHGRRKWVGRMASRVVVFFSKNWLAKLISLVLAILTWMFVTAYLEETGAYSVPERGNFPAKIIETDF